ncbi:peptidoglycan-binding protein [Demetria terragena]|uniref:peptidoglycan-binding protein n=1 Tax=Demetria terragena TaxID=63959 RepID=UPI00035C3F9F|nr:peptidoglycan-binding protein [Demetria terragena]
MRTNSSADINRRDMLRFVGIAATTLAATGGGIVLAANASAEPRIVSRSEWGFDGWAEPIESVPGHLRTHFVVHYQGGLSMLPRFAPKDGNRLPLHMHKEAKKDGPGIEYNFVISQKGEIFEGRGWDQRAGAVTGFNTAALSVQVHLRGGQTPTPEALHSLRWLYLATNRELGNPTAPQAQGIVQALQIAGHGEFEDTKCPGPHLRTWVADHGSQLRGEANRELGDANRKGPAPKAQPQNEFPGRAAFQVGQSHPAVVDLDHGLIRTGYVHHHDGNGYQPGEMFTEATRLNVADFQRAQGWSGSGADGFPGPQTWDRLVN